MSFKIALKFTNDAGPISISLRLGELRAEALQLEPYNKSSIRKILPDIQRLTYEHPDNWRDQLQAMCAECGLAVVYTPMIKKAPISGAAYWIKNGKTPLIQLTSRHKNNYAFWFHFYHELAHIILHGKKDVSLKDVDEVTGDTTTLENIQDDPVKEGEANNWASKQLLPLAKQKSLDALHPISRESILDLSSKWQIHPGIIVGYLARNNHSLYKSKSIMSLQVKVSF